MIDRNKTQTDEFKKANSKTVTVAGKKKLLLMDDEQENSEIGELDLQEIIETLVAEAMGGNIEECDYEEKEGKSRSLYEGYIDEADFPEGFDIQEFKHLSSFKKRVAYAKSHLERIAAGSGRVVFVADPDTVVKIALNKKGQAQNEVEDDISNMGYDIVAKVKDADSDGYLYLEVERAQKAKKSDWKNITGWSFGDWMAVFSNYMNESRGRRGAARELVPDDYEDIEETNLFSEIIVLIADYDLPVGDFFKISSWGIVNRDDGDKLVLVDYGLSKNVLQNYYQ